MNPSIERLRASDGTGSASTATVQSSRSPGASTINVDTTDGLPDTFYGSMGTPHTFVDPITAETITVISEATCVDFAGHIDGGDLEIDEIAPGATDLGSQVGDIVIIRPTTQWGDAVSEVLAVSHKDNGKIKDDAIDDVNMFTDSLDPVLRDLDMIYDFVVPGGAVITGDAYGSTRAISISAGKVYINGKRYTINAVTAKVLTASRDVYIDLPIPASGNVIANSDIVYTDVTTNAASPALAANRVRLGIVVVGASNIANVGSVNQGETNKVLPIVSSVPYAVTDSLGNLICPRDPNRRIIGYRQITADATTSSASFVQATGLTVPVIRPAGRKVRVTASSRALYTTTSGAYTGLALFDGTVAGTQFQEVVQYNAVSSAGGSINMSGIAPDAVGAKTYSVGLKTTVGTAGLNANPAYPAYVLVELT